MAREMTQWAATSAWAQAYQRAPDITGPSWRSRTAAGYPVVASAQLGIEATSRWPFANRPVAPRARPPTPT